MNRVDRLLLNAQGGGPLWTPLDLGTDLYAWWDASYAPSLSVAASVVSSWTDRKGGIVLSQAVSGAKPLTSVDPTGVPLVLFDGVDDYLSSTSLGSLPTGANLVEMWGVYDQRMPGSNATAGYIFNYGSTGSSVNTRAVYRGSSASINYAAVIIGTGSANIQAILSGAQRAALPFDRTHLIRGYLTGTGVGQDMDAKQSIFTTGGPASTNTNRVAVGVNYQLTGSFWNGGIAHQVITKPLSPANAQLLTAFMRMKGRITS